MSCKTANTLVSCDSYETPSARDSSDSTLGLISAGDYSAAAPSRHKSDPGGIGFVDEIGGSVNGFESCTESLGFESFDERSTDAGSSIDEFNACNNQIERGSETANSRRQRIRERSAEKRREVKFPPPLTSMNWHGGPSFVLQPVRKDGRLELTEVKIHRPEILCASRENGRLTIHLVSNTEEEEEEREDAGSGDSGEDLHFENEEDTENRRDRGGEEWRLPVAGPGGEGLRQCHRQYEGAAQHGHLEVWSPRCVTSR